MHDPNDPFAKQLEEMLAKADLDAKAPEPPPDTLPSPQMPAAPAPEEPEDPLARYIGKTGAEAERKDPFASFLDGCLADEGMSVDQEVVKAPEADQHCWEADRETKFEGDAYRVTCQKCFRSMEVGRDETIGQAMQRHLIARDCALQTIGEVMTS